jgi:hypothetical protein
MARPGTAAGRWICRSEDDGDDGDEEAGRQVGRRGSGQGRSWDGRNTTWRVYRYTCKRLECISKGHATASALGLCVSCVLWAACCGLDTGCWVLDAGCWVLGAAGGQVPCRSTASFQRPSPHGGHGGPGGPGGDAERVDGGRGRVDGVVGCWGKPSCVLAAQCPAWGDIVTGSGGREGGDWRAHGGVAGWSGQKTANMS